MKVEILNLQNLFQKQARYEIPEFQRRYIWNEEDQWESLWQDVQNTAEGLLDAPPDNTKHFMGAVVLQEQSTVTSDGLDRRIVVDGQQRLTTLQLLLDATQEQLGIREEPRSQAAAQRLSLLVSNYEAYRGDNSDNEFKVWPTTGDQEAFRQAMRNDLESEEASDSLIVQCHDFFKTQVQQWLDAGLQEREKRADALEEALARRLELVVLDLAEADEPHIIFETLNARGTPLLQSDLVKNMVLYESERAGFTGDTSCLWDFTDNWWNEDVRQGRLTRPRIESFLNYWLVLRTSGEVNTNRVFAEFREYVSRRENESIVAVAQDIRKVSRVYRKLEENSYPEMADFHYRWKVLDLGVLTPVLLWLRSNSVPQDQLTKALTALESFSVRRMLCRSTSQGTNRLFMELIARLQMGSFEQAGDFVIDFLGGQTASNRIWPDDQQVENVFLNSPLYHSITRGRLRMVLEAIEAELRTNKAETQSVPRGLTIEHIMPQSWQGRWPIPAGVAAEPRSVDNRNRIVHSIGNLTLVNTPLNSTLSNAPWTEKRQTLNAHTVLFLNKTLLEEAPAVWDEAAIEQRARRLCQVAIQVWPHANRIACKSPISL